VKTEMAGLDDPRMDGADGNLVQAWPLGCEEGVPFDRPFVGPRGAERGADRPAAMIEPGPPVRRVGRAVAEEIVDRAL